MLDIVSFRPDALHQAILELAKEEYLRSEGRPLMTSDVLKDALIAYAEDQGIDPGDIEARTAEISKRNKKRKPLYRIPSQYAEAVEEVTTLERYRELCQADKGYFWLKGRPKTGGTIHPCQCSHHAEVTFSRKVLESNSKNGAYFFSLDLDILVEFSGAGKCVMLSPGYLLRDVGKGH